MQVKMIYIHDEIIEEVTGKKRVPTGIVDIAWANTTGLLTTIYYQTNDGKPFNFLRIDFTRISFNEVGAFSFAELQTSDSFRNKLDYATNIQWDNDYFETEPLPVPIAPDLPNDIELKLLKKFFKEKYPIILENNPLAFESTISDLTKIHNHQKKLMINSHRKRKTHINYNQ